MGQQRGAQRLPEHVATHRHRGSLLVMAVLMALVLFALGLALSIPDAGQGIQRLIGNFAPSFSADYSRRDSESFKPQRPVSATPARAAPTP